MGGNISSSAAKQIEDEDDGIASRDYDDKDFRSSFTAEDEQPSSSSTSSNKNTDSIVLLENGGVEIVVQDPPQSSSSTNSETFNSAKSQRSNSDDDDGDALAPSITTASSGRADTDEETIGDYVIDEDEDVDADNGTNEDIQARERASMRQNYNGEDGDDYSQLIGTYGVEDDEFEDTALEFMQTYESKIYLMRRYQYPNSLLVIAHESTPLALYCRHVAVLKNQLHDSVMQMNPATLPTDSDDIAIQRHIPGILAQVVREVLHEPAQFVVGLDDGTTTRVIENDGDPSFSHPEGISLPLSAAPLMVLEPTDVNYKEKLDIAQRLQSTATTNLRTPTLESVDRKDEKDMLRRFSHTGRRMPQGRRASPGFTEHSPVQDENDVWLIITLPYYLMWLSYERTCEGNGNLLMKLNSTIGALDDNSYFFPVKMETDVTYTARQEHEVLRRALESYMKTLRVESEIALLHAQVKNFAEVACARLDSNFMNQIQKEVGKEASPRLSELLQNLSETASVLKNLDERLKELDTRRGLRSFTSQ